MTTQRVEKKRRRPTSVRVSPNSEWLDFHGIELLFGLRRSTAYHLSNEGLIKSVSLRHGDETRGKRLFNVGSIRQFLDSKLETKQRAAAKESENSTL